MTPYDASFKGVHILFDKENVQNTLGEYLAETGKPSFISLKRKSMLT